MRPENKVLHSADHCLTKLPQKSRHCSNKDQESRRNGENDSHVPAASVSRERSRRVGRKPPRKRRKVKGDEPDSSPARNRSGSGSHDKGNSRVGVKQIKIAKDKYSLPRGGRRPHQNDVTNSHTQGNTSQGGNGEKTLKLVCKVGKDKSSANIEDKKRALEMMNETIRRNNLKQNGVSKDQRDHSASQGGIYTSHTGPSSIFKKLLQSGAGLHHAEHSVEQSDMIPKMAQGKGEKPSSSAGLANKVFNTLTNPDSQKRKSPFGLSISPSGLPVNSLGNPSPLNGLQNLKSGPGANSTSLVSKPGHETHIHPLPSSSQGQSAVQYIPGLTAINLPNNKPSPHSQPLHPGLFNNMQSGERGVSEEARKHKKDPHPPKKDPILMKKSASTRPLNGFQVHGLQPSNTAGGANLAPQEQSSTTGHHTPIEAPKNKASTLRLEKKPKLAASKAPKSVAKRLNRQRRSKSSNDLISENLFKQFMGRSDSVNSRHLNEDQLYEEWRKMVPQDSHSALIREKYVRGTFRDQLQRAAQGLNPKTGQTLSPTAGQTKQVKPKGSKKEKHTSNPQHSKKAVNSDGTKGSKSKPASTQAEYFSGLSRLEGTVSARNKAVSMIGYIPASIFHKEVESDKRHQYLLSTLQKNHELGLNVGQKYPGKHPIAVFGGNQPSGLNIPSFTDGGKKSKRQGSKKTHLNGTGSHTQKKPSSSKETQQNFYTGKAGGQPGRSSQGNSKEGTTVISQDELRQGGSNPRVNIPSVIKKHEARDSNPLAQQKELNSGAIQSNFQSSELNTDERELIDREILLPNNYNSDPSSEVFQRAARVGMNLGSGGTDKVTHPISITQNSPDPGALASGDSRLKSSSSLLHQLPVSLRNGQPSIIESSENRVSHGQGIAPQANPNRPYGTEIQHRKIRDSASSDEDMLYQTEGGAFSQKGPSVMRNSDRGGDLTPAQTDYLIQLLQNTAVLNSETNENFGGLLSELKRYQQGGEIDEEVKERLKGFLEKTQRGLTQILQSSGVSNQTGRNSDKTATPVKLAEQPKSSHKRNSAKSRPEEGAWKKKAHLGLDLDDYEIDAEFEEGDRRTQSIPDRVESHTQGRSFQWLRAEYEKNMEDIGKLLGHNRKDELKQLGELVKSNEEFSKLFDLRLEALNRRYAAQKSQIKRTGPDSHEAKELLQRLEDWHQDEQSLLEAERKRITQIWLKSIDEVRKIKRDLEIATESRRIPGAIHDIYSAISRSLASPSGGAFHRKIALGSPGASPHTHKTRLVSDPEVIPSRKRPDIWSKHEEELGRSSEGLEPRISGSVDRSRTSLADSGRMEISENKKRLVREIEEGVRKVTKIPSLNGSGHLGGVLGKGIDFRGIGSSPGGLAGPGSADSSALFAVSPTVGTGGSKLQSSHKPRSTAKSGQDNDSNPGPIWIKDQQEQVPIPKNIPAPAKNASSSSIGGLGAHLTESGPLEFHPHESELLQNKSLPPHINKDQAPTLPPQTNKEPRLESHSQPNGIGNLLESSNGLQSSGAVFGLESIRRELEKIPPRQDETQGSGRREQTSKEATKKSALSKTGGNGDTDEYMMYDLIDGIGFDSGAINHEFEDSKKSPCELDDFASLSDSGREGVVIAAKNARRERLLQEADIVADQILDSLFDEAARGIVEILESENQKIENEIQEEYDQREPGIIQPYGEQQYIQGWQEVHNPGGFVMNQMRRGIRVNYNAIREYLSFLVNFVKSKVCFYPDGDPDTQKDIISRLNMPQGPSPAEKLMMFNEDLEDVQGGVTARAISRKVVGYDVYTRLEDELAAGKENEDQFKLKTEHVHNKMLFDSFNEALDNCRPYGLKGCPFPWRPNAGRIVAIQTPPEHFGEILERAQERVLEWAMFMCGFIPNKDDSMLGDIVLEDDYLNQIKEDRLIKMLTCEAFETDERWLIYDDEEVEVQTEVAELVFDSLLEEVVSSLVSIQATRPITSHKKS